jgi:hypothetical protein
LKTVYWLIAVILLLMCSACQRVLPLTATPASQQRLYKDDFSDLNSGWKPVSSVATNSTVGYADGVYRITVNSANRDEWATPGLNLADVRIEVDAIKIGGDRNNRFGIICRATGADSFYVFLISSDGYYGIGKIKGNRYELLGSEALLPSDKIPKGSAYLHLQADCIQDRLGLYVNGEKIAEARDAEFQTGDVGLIAGAYNTVGTDIFFDNFIVSKP